MPQALPPQDLLYDKAPDVVVFFSYESMLSRDKISIAGHGAMKG